MAQRESAAADQLQEDSWAILRDRKVLHKQHWALALDDQLLELVPAVSDQVRVLHAYFCALSLGGEVSATDRRLFEQCVTDLAPGISRGPAIRMGAPRAAPVPSSFSDAVAYYGGASLEMHKTIDEHSHDQDLGLDVATWIEFADRRGGYLHFIGQCATGVNWNEKLDEPIINQWRDRIQWAAEPVRFFALPFVIPTADWRRTCQASQLVLDRPRLIELAHRVALPATTVGQLEDYLAGYE